MAGSSQPPGDGHGADVLALKIMKENVLVRDIMTVGVPTCKWNTPLVEISRHLVDHNGEALCVLDSEGHGIGVVGIDELINAYAKDNMDSALAEEIMTEGVPEIQADLSLKVAAKIMQDKKVRVAYLMHNSAGIIYPAAYLTYRHILRYIAAMDDNELKDLGLAAERKSPVQTFIERRDAARKKAGMM